MLGPGPRIPYFTYISPQYPADLSEDNSVFIDLYLNLSHHPETYKLPNELLKIILFPHNTTKNCHHSSHSALEQNDDFLNNLIQKGVLHVSYFRDMKAHIDIIEICNLRNQSWKMNCDVTSLWLIIVLFSCMLIAWSPIVAQS